MAGRGDEAFSSWDESSWAAAELLAAVGVVSARELRAGDAKTARGIAELVAAGQCSKVTVDGGECFELDDAVKRAVLRNLDDDTVSELRSRSATIRESIGVLDCGLQTAWQKRDWTACGRILDRWWPQLGFSSFRPLSQRVMFAMPIESLRLWPGTWHRAEYVGILPIGEAPVDVPTDPDRIREMCRTGEAWLVLRRIAMAMASRRVHRRFSEAQELAVRARPIAEMAMQAAHGVSREFCAYWFLHAGIAHELAGDFDAGARMYRSGWQARHNDEMGFCARDLAGKLSASAALRGEHREARNWLHEVAATPRPRELWVTPFIDVAPAVAELMLSIDELDADGVRHSDERLDRPRHIDEYWSLVAFVQARRLVTWGDPFDALDLLDDAAQMNIRTVEDGVHRSLWGAARADALLAAGHATRAAGVLDGIAGSGFGMVSRARLSLLAGDPAEARRRVALSLDGSLWPRARTELLFIDAAASVALGETDAAVQALSRGVARVVEHHDLHALATVQRAVLTDLLPHVPPLAGLLEELDRSGAQPIYPESVDLVAISPRESAVLGALGQGRTLAETAAHLVVSPNTVKTQVRSLYTKLGVHTRQDLLLEARRLGLLTDGSA